MKNISKRNAPFEGSVLEHINFIKPENNEYHLSEKENNDEYHPKIEIEYSCVIKKNHNEQFWMKYSASSSNIWISGKKNWQNTLICCRFIFRSHLFADFGL